MQRSGGGSDRNKSFSRERSRSRSPQKGWGGSSGDGRNGGSHSYNGELEEGMIPDED